MSDQPQTELPLQFPELSGDMPLLPARMVNEYQYCPRLAYLEWVQGEWAASADTVEGSYQHRRVDTPSGELPSPEQLEDDQPEKLHARSITLSSNRLGLIAKMDIVEVEGNEVTPVDYKRGPSRSFRGTTPASSGPQALRGRRSQDRSSLSRP